jgi:dethiobiotin synthetase
MTNRCGFLVTGTDTGVGKTAVTLGLMQCLQAQGCRVAAMKPVASGCERHAAGLRNADALLLQQHASVALTYDLVNPYAFEPAIAPHIAAVQAQVQVDFERLLDAYQQLASRVDCVLVEGVGGWRVPLNEDQTLADLASLLDLDVILVVAVRLGCLNHALLSADAIAAAGCRLCGWVANRLPPVCDCPEENINALKSRISSPLLGVLPELPEVGATAVAEYLALPPLTTV